MHFGRRSVLDEKFSPPGPLWRSVATDLHVSDILPHRPYERCPALETMPQLFSFAEISKYVVRLSFDGLDIMADQLVPLLKTSNLKRLETVSAKYCSGLDLRLLVTMADDSWMTRKGLRMELKAWSLLSKS